MQLSKDEVWEVMRCLSDIPISYPQVVSYATDLMRDRYAQLALQLGWKYRLPASETHALAHYLAQHEDRHDQALLQMGVKWVKAHVHVER